MNLPEFDENYLATSAKEEAEKQLEQLCFRVQEVLGAYCLYDFSLAIDEETPAEFKPVAYKENNHSIDDSGDDDDDFEIDDFVSHEKTTPLYINDTTRAIVDNIPLVIDENGRVQQYIQPGFVSIKVIDDDDYHDIFYRRAILGICANTTQLIFRLPWHADGPAIFQGFQMDNSELVDLDDENEETINSFLEDLVDVLREDLINDSSAGTEEYCVQNMPVSSVGSAATQFLKHQV